MGLDWYFNLGSLICWMTLPKLLRQFFNSLFSPSSFLLKILKKLFFTTLSSWHQCDHRCQFFTYNQFLSSVVKLFNILKFLHQSITTSAFNIRFLYLAQRGEGPIKSNLYSLLKKVFMRNIWWLCTCKNLLTLIEHTIL